jgi:hypothetical protein
MGSDQEVDATSNTEAVPDTTVVEQDSPSKKDDTVHSDESSVDDAEKPTEDKVDIAVEETVEAVQEKLEEQTLAEEEIPEEVKKTAAPVKAFQKKVAAKVEEPAKEEPSSPPPKHQAMVDTGAGISSVKARILALQQNIEKSPTKAPAIIPGDAQVSF